VSHLRRLGVFITIVAALVLVSTSSAGLQPVRHSSHGRSLPVVRAGVIRVPAGHRKGLVTVIVDLQLPPLAAYDRSLQTVGYERRLNVASRSSRAYLAQLASAQRAAAAQLRRAIPQARIAERYRIVLDGFAVRLPARALPALARLSSVSRIYPSLAYTRETNHSPSVIGADTYWTATGDHGEGVKIGIVDDGVDQTNPFFNPASFTYPTGFPKGQTKFTTPKVIVARGFPGPGSGRQGRLPLDRATSFHATHVAGIAAGNSGTDAPPGPDHPFVAGLSGVAPRAWIGNYRVFNTPTPSGYDAFTPQIVAAFESAVADGMQVINFSGGGPEVEPQSDALVEAVRNVANAGVVPVISAGNDRDDFGLGSAGSPGIAPDAISVAAVSNTHVFSPALGVVTASAPATVKQIPFQSTGAVPDAWANNDQTLVDVGSIVGTDSQPIERHLCGPTSDPNGGTSTLPAHSLDGAIALVFRGTCTFASKAARAHAAGAAGIVLVDNRPGEANPLPVLLELQSGMISDLDGARLRDYLAANGGRAPIRVGTDPLELNTGRSGIVTSFSSAGPTAFGHLLKPDVAAPGGQILSSTLPEFAGSPFAVFDGTSMAAPHVTGAAALLVQHHPTWTPRQVKSALVSTAGAAWQDTARTKEASVLLEGGGLINVARADNPLLFTDPVSLSFGDLNANRSAQRRSFLLTLTDAGTGSGTWSVQLQPQSASAGANLNVSPAVVVPPGGTVDLPVVAQASAGATAGDDYGFIVLRKGAITRRIPYLFLVTRPELESQTALPLKKFNVGGTLTGTSKVGSYRFPTSPFGPAPDYFGPPQNEPGAEKLYVMHVSGPVANAGVAVIAQSSNSLIDPWFLGSQDENDVQGYAGTPIGANSLDYTYRSDVEAAGAVFPIEKRYYISVDSGADPYTGQSYAGQYILRSWSNDVTPPQMRFLTRVVTAGRPLLAARVVDAGAGVDPLSLVVGYRRVLVLASYYDPFSGIALFGLPRQAPVIPRGKTSGAMQASDFQESKNVDQIGANILPNTSYSSFKIRAVARPTVTWLEPQTRSCTARKTSLAVVAAAPKKITWVRFFRGQRLIARGRGSAGLYAATWTRKALHRGRYVLQVVVRDKSGAKTSARRIVRVCR
jgi:minor extracellular serine protease Vpr